MQGKLFDLNHVEKQIDKRVDRFLTAATGVAAAKAMQKTPREYGTLANSQFTSVNHYPDFSIGTVGYGASYAKYLNGLPGYNTPKWNPRPIDQKEGPSTNMNAEPEFLTKAFEEPSAIADFDRLAKTFLTV